MLVASLLLLVLQGNSAFLLVAAGAGYRLFTKDFPPAPSILATAYYVALLAGFALLQWIAPGPAFSFG